MWSQLINFSIISIKLWFSTSFSCFKIMATTVSIWFCYFWRLGKKYLWKVCLLYLSLVQHYQTFSLFLWKFLVIHYSETVTIAHIKTFLVTLKLEGDVDCWENETFTDNFKISVGLLTNQIATCSMKSWLLRTWESHQHVFKKTTTSSLQSYCLLINKIILTSPNESKPSHFSVYFHVWKTPLSNKFEKSLLQWDQNRMWKD